MRIAILGAGFAGLATTWHLLNLSKASYKIDLYDPLPISGGVSGLSSGLLHPYGGKHAHRSWKADRGMDATHRLITEAAKGVHQSLVISKGILRPATTEEQVTDFQKVSMAHPDVEWWNEEQCASSVKGLKVKEGGLYIKTGLTLDIPIYLEGLWQACAKLGAQFFQRSIHTDQELSGYDIAIFTMGYGLKKIPLFQSLPYFP